MTQFHSTEAILARLFTGYPQPQENTSLAGRVTCDAVYSDADLQADNWELGWQLSSEHGTDVFAVSSPIDGEFVASCGVASAAAIEQQLLLAQRAFVQWRRVPAPERGQLVRELGQQLRENKQALADLITLECGKITAEALGEVQEAIDICDFAVGLSRQLHGLTITSERPLHRMMEQWQPLGVVAIITAFNFPVAVWAWNAALALVCGNSLVWKPSEKTPLCALACQEIFNRARLACDLADVTAPLSSVVLGHRQAGEQLAQQASVALVSATGSVAMGRAVAQVVASRLGRSLLELGGNNAMVVAPTADMELAVRAIVFSAMGTAGQRCTSLRRLIVHRTIEKQIIEKLLKAYCTVTIGDPFDRQTLVGPLIDRQAYQSMAASLVAAVEQGGKLLCGGAPLGEGEFAGLDKAASLAGGCYVSPAIVAIDANSPILRQETFAPILYICVYDELAEAIAINNAVPQGLSSAIFTNDLREAELFLSAEGSDCGIANVNIGTSGAEIGGAFGGEKDTGGGRESGSDAWKNYMRRSTNTINYGSGLPLAQGISFE